MKSHNKKKYKGINNILSDDGEKTDKTITYSNKKSEIPTKSLTKVHKILIAITVIIVAVGVVVGVYFAIKNRNHSSGSGENPGTGGESGSGENPGTGGKSGSGENQGTGGESGSGENPGTGSGPNSGENLDQLNENNPITKEDIQQIIKPTFKVSSKKIL